LKHAQLLAFILQSQAQGGQMQEAVDIQLPDPGYCKHNPSHNRDTHGSVFQLFFLYFLGLFFLRLYCQNEELAVKSKKKQNENKKKRATVSLPSGPVQHEENR
jgi:hypothetical protein